MNNTRYPQIALFGIFCFVFAFIISYRVFEGDGTGWKHIITSDGRGYYAYLPALIIDGDPTFRKVVGRESRLSGYAHYKPGYLVNIDGHPVNKYFAGEALLLLPFFFLGLIFSWILGAPIDGYSFLFQLSIGLGALFYLMWGLFFLYRILRYFRIRPSLSAMLLVIILFGTNLLYYTIWQPTMSHIYSFFAINGLISCALSGIRVWDKRIALHSGFFLGMVFLIRPTNLVVLLLIPFFAGDRNTLSHFFKELWHQKNATALCILIILLSTAVQPVLWYLQTGRFFIWPYQNEGFRFSNPEITNVLFSFRKGLFVYTPLIFLSWFGLIYLAFKNRIRFFSMLVFLTSVTYLIASWWNWYYGDGYGLRAFIDYYGIFCLLLALPLNSIPWKVAKPLIVVLIVPLVFLNIFQTWQYTHYIIQPNSMNREKFQYVFLRADSAYINCLGGNQEIADYSVDVKHPDLRFYTDLERDSPGWNMISIIPTNRAYSTGHAGYLDSLHLFSPGLSIVAADLGKLPARYFVEGELMVWDSAQGATNKALVVLSMDSINSLENYWQGFRLNDFPRTDIKTWRKCNFSLTLPEISNPRGILKIYIWNTGKKPMLVDDFGLKFYRLKNQGN
ncbi:MAG: hypothetical protein M0P58_04685 [Bacteroidales bacterium]|nr:hypothetical protein [Bacteroidales bacterium]